jgi:hypothetical protein
MQNNNVFNTNILDNSSINNNVANDEQGNMSIEINNLYYHQGMTNILNR